MAQELGSGSLARPPIPPPSMPTLSTMRPPQMASDGMEEEASGGEMEAKGKSVLRLFFELEDRLRQLALVAPGQSEALDDIKTQLDDVRIAIINGGSTRESTIPAEDAGGAGPIKR